MVAPLKLEGTGGDLKEMTTGGRILVWLIKLDYNLQQWQQPILLL
jgi:hypothetical protein